MAKGFKKGGGGSNPFNFKVIGYATEELLMAAKPKVNTLGVITDKEITGHHFSSTQPEKMSEGEVWFGVGTTSPTAFNALKENTIMVYPISAKQYVSGALVDVTAKSYQGGKWVDWWQGELYKDGKLYNVLANGFEVVGSTTVVQYEDDHFICYSSGDTGVIASPEKINTTGYKTIRIVGGITYTSSISQYFKAGLATAKDENSFVSYAQFPNNAITEISIEIPSDGGEYYLVLTCAGSTSTTNCLKVTDIEMKRGGVNENDLY